MHLFRLPVFSSALSSLANKNSNAELIEHFNDLLKRKAAGQSTRGLKKLATPRKSTASTPRSKRSTTPKRKRPSLKLTSTPGSLAGGFADGVDELRQSLGLDDEPEVDKEEELFNSNISMIETKKKSPYQHLKAKLAEQEASESASGAKLPAAKGGKKKAGKRRFA